MDKKIFYNTRIPNWQLLSSAMDVQAPDLNCSSGQSPDCFLNPTWEKSTDRNIHFDSALSSMVSSPVASNSNISNDSFVLRELIGKLVNIGDPGGEMSPHYHPHPLLGNLSTASMAAASYISGNNSTNTSCYNTPLSSPPKLNSPIMDHLVKQNLPIMENSVPLNSSLMELSSDPGFAERAARFSCFGSRSFSGRTNQSTQYLLNSNAEFPYGSNPLMGNGKIGRVASSPSLKALESKSPMQDGAETGTGSVSGFDRKFSRLSGSHAEFASSPEGSPVSEQIPGGENGLKSSNDLNSRKRKAVPRGKAKEHALSQSAKAIKVAEGEDDSNAKRRKMIQSHGNENATVKTEEEQKGNTNTAADDEAQEQTKTNPKAPEPLKDYIHVRARRGQATDSHSLAERVRREKIGERMKLLQDLVPGCNKVTGKALMLDEIINYVQSLQHQVEFLSMKLASVDFRTDLSLESHLSKDHQVYGHQSEQRPILRNNMYNETAGVLDTAQCRNLSMQLPPLDGFSQGISQFPALCEDDLQSLVRMGLARI